MKKTFIVANWKSNFTTKDATQWLTTFIEKVEDQDLALKEIVICPSFTLLPTVFMHLQQFPQLQISLGAQDISPFSEGSFTGAVNGAQIKEFATSVLIGHSERRIQFKEDNVILTQKITMAQQFLLQSFLFIQNEKTPLLPNANFFVYEPPSAISPGKPDTPENANAVAQMLKKQRNITPVLYGGSVTQENVQSFTHMPNLDGVIVGKASLSPTSFAKIVTYA